MKAMIITEPTRETWHLFCSEPKLTPDELALWTEIKQAVRSGDHYDDELAEFFFAHIPPPERGERTEDWSDVVQSADDHRRWVRAHFPLYDQWKKQAARKQAAEARRFLQVTTS